MLFIHDIRLLDENQEPRSEARRADRPLKAGWHPVQVLYRSGNTKSVLSLTLPGPDGKPIPLDQGNLKATSVGW